MRSALLVGHEDAIHFNPVEHISSNATYANNATDLVDVIRQQFKEGADFIKIYETGQDSFGATGSSLPRTNTRKLS